MKKERLAAHPQEEKKIFDKIREKRIGFFSLKTRMTFVVGAIVLGSFLIAIGITELLDWVIPSLTGIPFVVRLVCFSLFAAMIATRFFSKIFIDPIKEVREGMQKVADGNFDVRLETASSSVEVQELYAGFNMMAQELGSTEILQTDFVSNVSHEFKTPINAIEGYTTLLQGTDNIDDTENWYIEKILFNTRRLSSLVSNILLLSKIENQSIQTNRIRFSIDEQIRQSILVFEPQWEQKNIEFDVSMEEVNYTGNESLMHHIWDNIIGNAVKFSPDSGRIRITLQKENGKIIFSVSDTGPGISEEAQKHIFDKFYQEDGSHKEEGNGLGLALVKRILSIVDGEIVAANNPSGGCTVTVTIEEN